MERIRDNMYNAAIMAQIAEIDDERKTDPQWLEVYVVLVENIEQYVTRGIC